MEGEDALGVSGGARLSDSLQKEINRREAFERKNAELEGVNDQLRVENGELRTQMQMLRKKLEEMAAKPRSSSPAASSTPEIQKKHQKSRQPSQKRLSGTPVHGADNNGQEEEVHTLRREKKALRDELEETKAKQLSFEAAFKTEFDLRTTIEEKYDSLRERYERLVVENDEFRRVLRQHNIPPPSLRAKLRITADGPMKPPRRKKRSGSLQPDIRPKSEFVARIGDNYYSDDYFPRDANSYRANSLSPDRRQPSASPSDNRQFLFTELSTIEGSCEISSKSVEDKEIKGEGRDENFGTGAPKRDQSNGQPLQPSRTPKGGIRKVQSHSVENIANQAESPGGSPHHQQTSSGTPTSNNSVNAGLQTKGGASELTGQPETFKSHESVGVTITVSTEADIESTQTTSNQSIDTNAQSATALNGNTEPEKESAKSEGEDKHHSDKQQSSDGSAVVAPKEEHQEISPKKPENMEWELDNLMETSAQQLESAKAFYAEMHAHLKKKENSDNDSDD